MHISFYKNKWFLGEVRIISSNYSRLNICQIFLSLRLEEEETLKYRCICRGPHAESFNIVTTMVARRSAIFPFSTGNYFFGQIWSKNQNCQFKLKFGALINSYMLSSMVMFTFSIFDWKTAFWANLVKKMKIVKIIWNLVPRLIRICRIQWCGVHFIYFRLGIPFLDKLGPTNKNNQFKLKFGTYMQNSMTLLTFFWLRSETLF